MSLDHVFHLVDEFGRAMRDNAKEPESVTPWALNQKRDRLREAIRLLAEGTPEERTATPVAEAVIERAAQPRPSSSLTTDPNDPRLKRGAADEAPGPQAPVYLVLGEQERAKGFVRPYRDSYVHDNCPTPGIVPGHAITTMGRVLSETYARDPGFYGATYCCHCRMHRPVAEFHWHEKDGTVGPVVGT